MNDRTKSALLLVATLAIGMVLGSLITGAVANRRLDDLADARGRMGAFFLRAIEPESEEQAEAIRAVLDGAAPRFREVFESTREEMKHLSDSVLAELDPILTVEQKQRLEERMRLRLRRPPIGPDGRPRFRDGPRPESPPGMGGAPPDDSSRRLRRHRPPDGAAADTMTPGTESGTDAPPPEDES